MNVVSNKRLAIGLFTVLVLTQLAVPFYMILRRESTLRDGRAYRFRAAPVDPYDAFRGKYVALSFEQSSMGCRGLSLARGQQVFAAIVEDAQGFASLTNLSPQCPAGVPYLKARVQYAYGDTARLELPFDRYYMEETMAPRAEQAYRDYNRGRATNVWAQVRVRNGFAVLEDLYVAGRPMREFVRTPKGGTGTGP